MANFFKMVQSCKRKGITRVVVRSALLPAIASIVILSGLIFTHKAYALTNVTSCSVLNIPGETYNVINNIISPVVGGTCLDISADNITLDCQNLTIVGN